VKYSFDERRRRRRIARMTARVYSQVIAMTQMKYVISPAYSLVAPILSRRNDEYP
jgi:hypothetical protein